MAVPPSADIILFPTRRLSTPFYGPADPCPPDARLSMALNTLSAALTEQQQAVQRWRDALAELAACMRALSLTLPAGTA